MPDDAVSKWNDTYRDSTQPGEVARVLTDYQHLLPLQGRCLDVACGLGGNALWLAGQGLDVDAWDVSEVAIDKLNHFAEQQGLDINTRVVDVTQAVIPMNTYDCIFVGHFLERSSLPGKIRAGLRPGGTLFYQTFTRAKVDDSGPSNPAYLLGENELLRLFQGLVVRAFRDEATCGDVRAGLRNESYLVAQRPA